MKGRLPYGDRDAFTLLELLVVIAIIVILLAVLAPAVSGINRGASLTRAGQVVVDQLNLARQTALSRSRLVEVRFYQIPNTVGGGLSYHALQVLLLDERGEKPSPVGRLITLPTGVVLSDLPTYCSLLPASGAGQKDVLPQIDPSNPQAFYSYLSVQFRPNGAAGANSQAPATPWFMTLLAASDNRTDVPPSNYYSIKINPLSGRTEIYRP